MSEIYSQEDLNLQLKANKKVLAVFYSSWCPFCNRFLPSFNRQIQGKGFENIVRVVLDDDDNPIWEKYGIEAVPTLIYFEDSEVAKRLDARLGLGLNETMLVKWLGEFKR